VFIRLRCNGVTSGTTDIAELKKSRGDKTGISYAWRSALKNLGFGQCKNVMRCGQVRHKFFAIDRNFPQHWRVTAADN
jgi:hypothetical protein